MVVSSSAACTTTGNGFYDDGAIAIAGGLESNTSVKTLDIRRVFPTIPVSRPLPDTIPQDVSM